MYALERRGKVKTSWKFDSTTRHVMLKDYKPKERKFLRDEASSKAKSNKSSSSTSKKSGVCFDWIEGKACHLSNCRWLHTCTACDISKPKPHDLSKCAMKEELGPRIKNKIKKRK